MYLPIVCIYTRVEGSSLFVLFIYSFSPEKDVKYLSSPQTFDLVIQNNQTLLKRKKGGYVVLTQDE